MSLTHSHSHSLTHSLARTQNLRPHELTPSKLTHELTHELRSTHELFANSPRTPSRARELDLLPRTHSQPHERTNSSRTPSRARKELTHEGTHDLSLTREDSLTRLLTHELTSRAHFKNSLALTTLALKDASRARSKELMCLAFYRYGWTVRLDQSLSWECDWVVGQGVAGWFRFVSFRFVSFRFGLFRLLVVKHCCVKTQHRLWQPR